MLIRDRRTLSLYMKKRINS